MASRRRERMTAKHKAPFAMNSNPSSPVHANTTNQSPHFVRQELRAFLRRGILASKTASSVAWPPSHASTERLLPSVAGVVCRHGRPPRRPLAARSPDSPVGAHATLPASLSAAP